MTAIPTHASPQKRLVRCALYARVSTDNHDQDPEQQLAVLRREAAHRGFHVVAEYRDEITGSMELWDRPEGLKLWQMVNQGAIDVVMTYDASRLSREHPSAVFNLLDKLEKRGVHYVSATERFFDTSDDNDFRDLVIGLVAWANNYYIKQLKRSTKRGKDDSKKAGIPQGRHPVGCGRDFPCPTGAHGPDGKSRRRHERGYKGWRVKQNRLAYYEKPPLEQAPPPADAADSNTNAASGGA